MPPLDGTVSEYVTVAPVAEKHWLADSHEAQIRALTDPGLSDEERVRRFCEAAEADARRSLWRLEDDEISPEFACWDTGNNPKSLFADLRGCRCPVFEVTDGRAKWPGIPSRADLTPDWRPTRATLEAFSRVQKEHRPNPETDHAS